MGRKYHCDICEGIHESARELFELGAISEAEMREFDEGCLVEEPEINTAAVFFDAKPETLEMEHVTA